jgi:hypothetical protein
MASSGLRSIRVVVGAIAAAGLSPPLLAAHAQATNAPTYGPFDGGGYLSSQGYQELKMGVDRWYVAYQGNRGTSPDWVEAAWHARCAQLCSSTGATHFIALRYPFEPVLRDDPAISLARERASESGRMTATAGPVYIPIYTPSAPRVIVPETGPYKMAAVRCVADADSAKDTSRLVSVTEALERARQQGISVK